MFLPVCLCIHACIRACQCRHSPTSLPCILSFHLRLELFLYGCGLQMTVLMDTMCVPVDLRAYLPLYLELITESPVLRDDGECAADFYWYHFILL